LASLKKHETFSPKGLTECIFCTTLLSTLKETKGVKMKTVELKTKNCGFRAIVNEDMEITITSHCGNTSTMVVDPFVGTSNGNFVFAEESCSSDIIVCKFDEAAVQDLEEIGFTVCY
jgi:hypothetical protein